MINQVSKNSILITGSAGFIGFHLAKKLLELDVNVIGYDNLNDYYDVNLKKNRLKILNTYSNYKFIKGDLINKKLLEEVFKENKIDIVVNLAAQAGVRYSIDNPDVYIDSNVIGFYNLLEVIRHNPIKHLLYASSSSIYGNSSKIPFNVNDKNDEPVSLYAATKKTNELFAYTYSHLYNIPTTGLRFFTVYGPYGRPDMAYYSFTNKIINNETIKLFNEGNMLRDFTYIDDIIETILKIIDKQPINNYKLYNIGNNKPERLLSFVSILETLIGKEAKIEYLPMQPGDVYQTYADVSELIKDFNYKPNTSVEQGLTKFYEWYKKYYKINF